MPTFRCTRNSTSNPNISERQGHYMYAANEAEALLAMQQQFPTDKVGFTADLWQEGESGNELQLMQDIDMALKNFSNF